MVQVAPNRYPRDNWNPGMPGKAKPFEWERIGQYEFLRRWPAHVSNDTSANTAEASRGFGG